MLVNSSPMSTVAPSSENELILPAGPESASRSVGSPEFSVAMKTLPFRDYSPSGLEKVATGMR